jgi:surfactin synthase thioesterase subunit
MHPWLPDLGGPSAEAEVDVFAFPHAGASADAFRPLMRQLPDRVALRPLELPGRGRRMDEEPGWQLIPLVAELADAIAKAHARPAVFFGHSMGALLAFETARALRGRVTPRHLVLSGHRGPQLERGDLRGHEDDDATFAEELRRWGGEDATWLEDPGLRELFLPVLRADFRALVAYRFQAGAPLPIPFTVLGGDQDPYLDEAGLDAWSVHTTGGFEKRLVPGAHFFWFRDPQVLARALVEAAEV